MAVLLTFGACAGPRISTFAITPQVLCPGQTAVFHWQASGDISIAIRRQEPTDPQASAGQDVFAVTLVSEKSNDRAERRVEFVQLRPSAAELIGFASRLDGDGVSAQGEKNVMLWGDRIEVVSVKSTQGRNVTVQHAGKAAMLGADGMASDGLAGTLVSGAWQLRSPFTDREKLNPGLRPTILEVQATVRCREVKP